jgi:xanthine dehydrogenase accessory factor
MTNPITMNSTPLFILGKGDIARYLVRIAQAADYAVTVCEPGLAAHDWPNGVQLVDKIYSDAPWSLPVHSHAVIARGHEGDAQSVVSLLQQGAEHVYLIASARRAQAVIQQAQTLAVSPLDLERLSAPAGLDLGGSESADIALSIVAEIQWRRQAGSLLPLRELRQARAAKAATTIHDADCPGRRA